MGILLDAVDDGTFDSRRSSALQVQRQQPREDGVLVNNGGVRIIPAVGGPDGAVEGGVGVPQPRRFLVVEVGERALLELGLGGTRRVEPVLAQLVEALRRLADGDPARIIDRLGARRPGEGEGLEAGGRGVCGPFSPVFCAES